MNRVPLLLSFAAAACMGCASRGAMDQTSLPYVRFEQTPCFGPCAVFVLEVESSGAAVWTVRKPFLEGPLASFGPGTYRAELPMAAHLSVLDAAEAVDFTSLLPLYDNPRIMDLPSTRYTVGATSVEQRYGGPDLSILTSAFFRALEVAVWQKDPSASSPQN